MQWRARPLALGMLALALAGCGGGGGSTPLPPAPPPPPQVGQLLSAQSLTEIGVDAFTAAVAAGTSRIPPLQPRYAARDPLRGREVTLSDGRHGQCEGVATDGALIVHTAQGRQAITSAEVSVRPVV